MTEYTPRTVSKQTIVVTGASSGIGALTVRALARAGHTVYAGIRDTAGRNAHAVTDLTQIAARENVDLHAVDMDVSSQPSVDAAIAKIIDEQGHLDVIVHNAGHMVLGPSEAFTPEEYADIYDVNVLGTQRVNRAALPYLRRQGSGLLIWVSSSSTLGGHTPFIVPYFAAKAAMDSLAESYAGELIRFGIDTSIVVPGAFTSGTSHFDHAGHPTDTERAAAYDAKYGTLMEDIRPRLAALAPKDADVSEVADVIVTVVNLPRASDLSAFTTTRTGTEAKSSPQSKTGSGSTSTTVSASMTCSPQRAASNPHVGSYWGAENSIVVCKIQKVKKKRRNNMNTMKAIGFYRALPLTDPESQQWVRAHGADHWNSFRCCFPSWSIWDSNTQSLRVQLHNTHVKVFELALPPRSTPLMENFGSDSFNSTSPGVMKVDKMVRAAIKSLGKDTYEIRPGTSNVLKVMSRLSPTLMLRQLSRPVANELAKAQLVGVRQ